MASQRTQTPPVQRLDVQMLAAVRHSGARRLLLLSTAVRHASALTAVALRAQSILLPARHRTLRCGPTLLSWEPPQGFKAWKEGDVPFGEEDDEALDMFDLGPGDLDRKPERRRPASSAEDFVEALLDVPAGCCGGCGALFQSGDEQAPGFVPQSVLESRTGSGARSSAAGGAGEALPKAEAVCQRCHGLRYQNRLPADALRVGTAAQHADLQPEHFRQLLRGLARRRCLIIAVVDLFDFDGSFTPDLSAIVGPSNPLIIVANKVDLLPDRANPDDVKRWVRRACARHGVSRVSSTHLVSCKSGVGLEKLLGEMQTTMKERSMDCYVVGAANAGAPHPPHPPHTHTRPPPRPLALTAGPDPDLPDLPDH